MKHLFAITLALACGTALPALDLDWVTVGDVGNAAHADGFGAVNYQFRITKHEITNAQYAEFLNAVAKADPYQLYTADMAADVRGGITRSGASGNFVYTVKSGYPNKPVVHVSMKDAQRFCNWIHNGLGTDGTESGAYTPGDNAVHTGEADAWIPTEDEWFKAAYYQPTALGGDADGYWLYATRSNTQPTSAVPPSSIANAANYTYDDGLANGINGGRAVTQDMSSTPSINYLSDVGAYSASPSYYGTFDQTGNVWEWTEGSYFGGRALRGASWVHTAPSITATGARSTAKGFDQLNNLGFRIASAVPGAPRPQNITFDPVPSWTYEPNGNSFTVAGTSSSKLPVTFSVASGPATISGNTVTITGVGSVTLEANQVGGIVGLREYQAAEPVQRTFTVTKGWQELDFPAPPDRPTNSAPQMLVATSDRGLPAVFEIVSGPAIILGTELTLIGAPGVVAVRALQAGNEVFHPATPVVRSFTVNVAGTQTITFATPPNRFLSEGTATLSAVASSGLPVAFELVSGPATLAGPTLSLTGVGTVKVKATQSGNAEFKPAVPVERTFKVLANPLSLTLLNLNQTYDGQPKPIGTAGTMDPVTITYGKDNSATPPVNAGTYPVKVVAGAVTKTGTLIINKALLTVTPDDKERLIGTPNPALTFTYSGFVGTDGLSAVTKAPALKTTATTTSAGGIYPITASGGIAANYAFRYLAGQLRVISFAGKYEALIVDSSQLTTGKLEINIPATGVKFTGKFSSAAEVAMLPASGTLTLAVDGQTASSTFSVIKGSNTHEITLTLGLDGSMTGALKLNTASYGTLARGRKLLQVATGIKVGHSGAYTLVLAPAAAVGVSNPFPGGSGHAVGTIDARGTLSLTGRLADGTPWSASAGSDEAAGYRLFAKPYTGRNESFVGGWLVLQSHPNVIDAGLIPFSSSTPLHWRKKGLVGDKSYRAGFGLLSTICTLDPWLPPLAATKTTAAIMLAQRLGLTAPANEWNVVHSSIASASASSLPTTVTLTTKNLVGVVAPVTIPANSTKWKVAIVPGTGSFSGSFVLTDPEGQRPVNFFGAMRQPPALDTRKLIGAGHFMLPALRGAVSTEQLSGEIRFELP